MEFQKSFDQQFAEQYEDMIPQIEQAFITLTNDLNDLLKGDEFENQEERVPKCSFVRVITPSVRENLEGMSAWKVEVELIEDGEKTGETLILRLHKVLDIHDLIEFYRQALKNAGINLSNFFRGESRYRKIQDQLEKGDVAIELREKFRRLIELKLEQYQERIETQCEDLYEGEQVDLESKSDRRRIAYELRIRIGKALLTDLEADVRTIGESMFDEYPELKWDNIYRFGNILAHEAKIMKEYAEHGGFDNQSGDKLPEGTEGVPLWTTVITPRNLKKSDKSKKVKSKKTPETGKKPKKRGLKGFFSSLVKM